MMFSTPSGAPESGSVGTALRCLPFQSGLGSDAPGAYVAVAGRWSPHWSVRSALCAGGPGVRAAPFVFGCGCCSFGFLPVLVRVCGGVACAPRLARGVRAVRGSSGTFWPLLWGVCVLEWWGAAG